MKRSLAFQAKKITGSGQQLAKVVFVVNPQRTVWICDDCLQDQMLRELAGEQFLEIRKIVKSDKPGPGDECDLCERD